MAQDGLLNAAKLLHGMIVLSLVIGNHDHDNLQFVVHNLSELLHVGAGLVVQDREHLGVGQRNASRKSSDQQLLDEVPRGLFILDGTDDRPLGDGYSGHHLPPVEGLSPVGVAVRVGVVLPLGSVHHLWRQDSGFEFLQNLTEL